MVKVRGVVFSEAYFLGILTYTLANSSRCSFVRLLVAAPAFSPPACSPLPTAALYSLKPLAMPLAICLPCCVYAGGFWSGLYVSVSISTFTFPVGRSMYWYVPFDLMAVL